MPHGAAGEGLNQPHRATDTLTTMPVYRRRPARQIAKVNATSIDGYFGEGTPCFFIRGTILSDTQVDGEYLTLAIGRPGNLIEIEAFDGSVATVVIATRSGNRNGDNLRARMRLRDIDLRAVGIDCERVMAGLVSLEQPPAEPEALDAPMEPLNEPMKPLDVPVEPSHNGSNNGVAHAPVAESEPAPAPAVPGAPASAPDFKRSEVQSKGRTSIVDGRMFIEIGASVIAIALPVVLFFLRSLFAKRDER